MCLPLFVGALCLSVLVSIPSGPLLFCNHLNEEEKTGCFALIVLWMSCNCICSAALPRGTVGCSAVCDCSIS